MQMTDESTVNELSDEAKAKITADNEAAQAQAAANHDAMQAASDAKAAEHLVIAQHAAAEAERAAAEEMAAAEKAAEKNAVDEASKENANEEPVVPVSASTDHTLPADANDGEEVAVDDESVLEGGFDALTDAVVVHSADYSTGIGGLHDLPTTVEVIPDWLAKDLGRR
jgi:hypothetical protein